MKRTISALSLVCVLATATSGLAARPPNFIIILCDDLGYGDVGCFGSKTIKTPNIDRMAAEGMRFMDFYVTTALCSPSRAGLMTGCYPRRVGLGAWVLRPDATIGIHPKEITIAELLKTRGYATGCIGKWHLGFLPPFWPTRQGFDYYYGLYHNLDRWETKYFDDQGGVPILRNEEVVARPAEPAKMTELYTQEAIGFIRRNRERSFFLYFAHTMPHLPFDVTERFKGTSVGGLYGDVVECLDWSTGRILDTLRELDLDRQTIVVFASDNGPERNTPGSAGPLRGTKHTTYEGGLRVPCVMRGPGHVAAGKVCAEIATTMDLLPTFGLLAGAKLPTDRVIDGKDIRPLIAAKPGARSPHEAFFYHEGKNGELAAVRSGKWKLHVKGKRSDGVVEFAPTELYDLAADIGEKNNVIAEHPDVAKKMVALCERFDREIAKTSRPVGRGEN